MFGRLRPLFGGGGRLLAVVAVAAAVALGVGAGRGSASGGVLKVRLGGDAVSTRVVVDLDRSVKGQIVGTDPRKVVLSLPGVDAPGALQGRGTGLVSAWSVERAGGAARVNLTLSREAVVKRRFLLPPGDGVDVYRYVVDLEARPGSQSRVAAGGAPARVQTRAPAVAADPRPRSTRRVVVIDP
ncbi:N-acetylmuramoyl-L-alanine amidase, partial [Caulobacter sp. 17J65-9]|nr:N-acetylmuramoyl-L-alanine amidase [Caulobacter sp. 17J65-9]